MDGWMVERGRANVIKFRSELTVPVHVSPKSQSAATSIVFPIVQTEYVYPLLLFFQKEINSIPNPNPKKKKKKNDILSFPPSTLK